MKIAITGSSGFVAKNLIAEMEYLKEFDLIFLNHSMEFKLQENLLGKADLVIHLAGVNRPDDKIEFTRGNEDYTNFIVNSLMNQNRIIPVIFASSKQVILDNDYGFSKSKAELILKEYSNLTGSAVSILRFPNIFGKWSKPNYNSVVATFCHNIIRDIPIHIHNATDQIELLYIDQAVQLLLDSIKNSSGVHIIDEYINITSISVQELANRIYKIDDSNKSNHLPELKSEFDKYLFATYISYLPADKLVNQSVLNRSDGAQFTELLKLGSKGQIAINTIKPAMTKGNHWHHTKHEKYIVVSGQALIRLRKKYNTEVVEYKLKDTNIAIIDIPPGTVHSITNTGNEDLVTIIWASEVYDKFRPDTFKEEV
jgi:UDP-2-acetamido-2,6-beta-L-arabino-hexul-4-ose reductase